MLPNSALTSTTKDANPMIEADSEHSTPPLNSASIQESNPPPEAGTESVGLFFTQPAIGSPKTRTEPVTL
jgi:hypothetical protein